MMFKIITLICLLLAVVCGRGQSVKNKPGWLVLASVGAVAGQSATGPSCQVVGAATYKRYSLGLGASYEKYQYKTFNLFADGKVNIGRLIFLYGQIGINRPAEKLETDEWKSRKLEGGLYWEGGVGFRMPVVEKHGIIVSAGLGQQQMRVTESVIFPDPDDRVIDMYRHRFNRYGVRVGYEVRF